MRLTIFYIILFSAVLVAQEPAWFTEDTGKEYPSAFYFVGTGSGINLDAAIQSAQNQIASQIRVKIDSESNLKITESAYNGTYNVKEKFERNINSYIDQTLTGVEIKDKEKSGDLYYVRAVLRKDKFLEEIEAKLDQLNVNIDSYIKYSNENSENGDIQGCLKFLLKAKDHLVDFNSTKAFYDALSNIPYDLEGATDKFVRVESDIEKLSHSIVISNVEGDGQEVEVGSDLPIPLKYRVVSDLQTKVIPLNRFPLIVFNESGNIIDRYETNSSGEITISSIPFTSSKSAEKISAKVNSSLIDEEVRDLIKPTPAVAVIKTKIKVSNEFAISVVDKNGNTLKDVESKIGRILKQCGQSVGNGSDYVIKGKISDYDTSEMNSFKGKMYTVKYETDLELIRKSSNEKLGFITVKGVGTGENEKDALKKSIQGIKINTEDILKLISNL